MVERPLLMLAAPGTASKSRRFGGGDPPQTPGRARQAERLAPKLEALQQAFIVARPDASGTVPEQVIVLETVGAVPDFLQAVRRIEGMEWLAEIEEEGIPPDDDFFFVNKKTGAATAKAMNGRLFLVFANQQGLAQLQSLWARYKAGQPFEHGTTKWRDLFEHLHDVRVWGLKDRLEETGILDDWRDRVAHGQSAVPCEIELWYRQDSSKRHAAVERVSGLLESFGGEFVSEAVIDDISYHAILARLPIESVEGFLQAAGGSIDLVQCEAIQFFRASGQMAGVIDEDARGTDHAPLTDSISERAPVVALFDGLPLQNHRRLAGRLVVDDPDGFGEDYLAATRCHGTAMASLILHGDLGAGEPPLARPIYVRPILRPDPRDWNTRKREAVPERVLVVDLIHRAVRRLFEGDGNEPPAAPTVAVINLSVGIADRGFDHALSPLARLLDWLSAKYRVLFVVSAGNHVRAIDLMVPCDQTAALLAADRQAAVVRALAADARHRRLLSPAEALNPLVVGATHRDACADDTPLGSGVLAYASDGLPSVINPHGMGYRRSIKPDLLMAGGRAVLTECFEQPDAGSLTRFDVRTQTRAPGQLVAAPGSAAGDFGRTWHTRGTSNAAALLSRAASQIYDVVDDLRGGPGGELVDAVPPALWLKVLLAHGARWGEAGEVLTAILRTPENRQQFREYLSRLLGYGEVDASRVGECTEQRVTALGGGALEADQSQIHRFPLPPSLSGKTGMRRLIVTLAWFTPVNPSHQAWRRADLWFVPPKDTLRVDRADADWRAVQRGTLQHECLQGTKAAAFVDGDQLEVRVSCRADAGDLAGAVPYALAVTLEVDEAVGVTIYEEVRSRVHAARIAVRPGT